MTCIVPGSTKHFGLPEFMLVRISLASNRANDKVSNSFWSVIFYLLFFLTRTIAHNLGKPVLQNVLDR